MNLIDFVNKKLAIETVIAQFLVLASLGYLLFFKKKYPAVGLWLSKQAVLLAFLVALGATVSSLFYSNIAGFEPCELCWFQRIFMYPLVVLLGLALIKKERIIIDYALSISVIGFFISLYHNYVYYQNGGLSAICQVGGVGVSCVKRYVFELGYITIPIMSLTAFVLIITFLVFASFNVKNHVSKLTDV